MHVCNVCSAELGDYDAEVHSLDFISQFHFVPHQTAQLEQSILDKFRLSRSLRLLRYTYAHSYTLCHEKKTVQC